MADQTVCLHESIRQILHNNWLVNALIKAHDTSFKLGYAQLTLHHHVWKLLLNVIDRTFFVPNICLLNILHG